MVDRKVHDLTDIGVPAATDELYIVGAPAATPVDRRVQVGVLRAGKSVDNPYDFIVANGAASAFDYEFDGATASLPSGWSWLNQGSATYLEALGGGTIRLPASASYNWRGLVQTITGSSWLATTKLGFTGYGGTEVYNAMALRESSSGKLFTMSMYQAASTRNWYTDKWTDQNTYSAAGPFQAGIQTHQNSPVYMRIRKNSITSYDFEMSSDGLAWNILHGAYDPTGFMTPDQVGFMANPKNSNPADLTCYWFRVR